MAKKAHTSNKLLICLNDIKHLLWKTVQNLKDDFLNWNWADLKKYLINIRYEWWLMVVSDETAVSPCCLGGLSAFRVHDESLKVGLQLRHQRIHKVLHGGSSLQHTCQRTNKELTGSDLSLFLAENAWKLSFQSSKK